MPKDAAERATVRLLMARGGNIISPLYGVLMNTDPEK